MLARIVKYGVIGGLIMGAEMIGLSLAGGYSQHAALGMAIGYASMLIALTTVFIAIKRQRDEEGGGVIRFWPAFGLGLGVACIGSLFYVFAWELIQAFSKADFAQAYAASMVEGARASGLSGAALKAKIAEAEQFRRDYANPLFRLPMTFVEIFPVGVLVSLVSAALLRNPAFLPRRRETVAT